MKTTYNLSKIMKEAHYWKKVLGYTMSEALKMSWRNAKKAVSIQVEARAKNEVYEKMYAERAKNTKVSDMSYLANTLTAFYRSGAYTGD